MLRRIESRLILEGISKKELAVQLGIGYNTLLNKLNGVSHFTLDEAWTIKKIIRAPESIELLFDRTA